MAKIQESGIHNGSVDEKKGKSRDCSRDHINTKRKRERKEVVEEVKVQQGDCTKKESCTAYVGNVRPVKFDARTEGKGKFPFSFTLLREPLCPPSS